MEGLNLEYNGFKGTVEWSEEDKCWVGRLLDLDEGCSAVYGGESRGDLMDNFVEAVDTYLEELAEGMESIRIVY